MLAPSGMGNRAAIKNTKLAPRTLWQDAIHTPQVRHKRHVVRRKGRESGKGRPYITGREGNQGKEEKGGTHPYGKRTVHTSREKERERERGKGGEYTRMYVS